VLVLCNVGKGVRESGSEALVGIGSPTLSAAMMLELEGRLVAIAVDTGIVGKSVGGSGTVLGVDSVVGCDIGMLNQVVGLLVTSTPELDTEASLSEVVISVEIAGEFFVDAEAGAEEDTADGGAGMLNIDDRLRVTTATELRIGETKSPVVLGVGKSRLVVGSEGMTEVGSVDNGAGIAIQEALLEDAVLGMGMLSQYELVEAVMFVLDTSEKRIAGPKEMVGEDVASEIGTFELEDSMLITSTARLLELDCHDDELAVAELDTLPVALDFRSEIREGSKRLMEDNGRLSVETRSTNDAVDTKRSVMLTAVELENATTVPAEIEALVHASDAFCGRRVVVV
jgi:hypothetical protein